MRKKYFVVTEDLFLYEGAEAYEAVKPSKVGVTEEDEDYLTLKKGTVLTGDLDDQFCHRDKDCRIDQVPLRKLSGEIVMWVGFSDFDEKKIESMKECKPSSIRQTMTLFITKSEFNFNWQTGGLYEAEILFRASDEDGHPRFNWDLFFKTKDDPDPEGNPIVDYCEVNYMDDKNWPSGDERHNFNSFSEAMAFVKEDAKKRGIKV